MNSALVAASVLSVLVAAAHSILGERYILIRLFRRADLPRLFGSDWFTRRTLRFAWHLTSLAWLGFGALLALFAADRPPARSAVLHVVAVTFAATAVVTATTSRGRHLAWLVFGAIAVLVWTAA